MSQIKPAFTAEEWPRVMRYDDTHGPPADLHADWGTPMQSDTIVGLVARLNRFLPAPRKLTWSHVVACEAARDALRLNAANRTGDYQWTTLETAKVFDHLRAILVSLLPPEG